jgi:hypothetical protein
MRGIYYSGRKLEGGFDRAPPKRELKSIIAKQMPSTAAGLGGCATRRRLNEKRATTRRAQRESEVNSTERLSAPLPVPPNKKAAGGEDQAG